MDNLTHSLLGLTLARTPLRRVGPGATTALLLASNAPDIDIVVAATGGASRYLSLHRGPTHGPLGLVILSFGAAAIAWGIATRRPPFRRGDRPARLMPLWAVSIVGVCFHVLMDLPTSYGTRWLSPWSWTWFTLDWMPIVDVYLLAILAGGLVAPWLSRDRAIESARTADARRGRFAASALALAVVLYGIRGAAHHSALEAVAPPSVLASEWCADAAGPGTPLDRWPERVLPHAPRRELAARASRAGFSSDCATELVAIPDFLSPFRWRVIARSRGEYRAADLNLAAAPWALFDAWRESGRRLVHESGVTRVPNDWNSIVRTAAAAPSAQTFLGFSRLPAVQLSVEPDGSAVVRWVDLRFFRDMDDVQDAVRKSLFGATVVIDGSGHVVRHELGP